jgi:glutamate racemase
MSDLRPIGVFDSGVGGLSVLQAIRRELPAEDLLYVADSGFAPYGDRDREFIEGRAVRIVEFLRRNHAKAIVVACNTATGVAVETLRARHTIPIVAIEPAVKPAAAQSRRGIVGVLATTRTLSSPKFLKLVDAHAGRAQVLVQPCPGLVEQVEEGRFEDEATRALVQQYVGPLVAKGADTLVLGCTHYPFLRPLIQDAAGAGVTIIDPALAVARELRRRLDAGGLLADGAREGSARFWTSGDLATAKRVLTHLWGGEADVQALGE